MGLATDGAANEAPLPAKQSAPEADSRISCAHGHEGWSPGPEPSACEGPQAHRSLKPTAARQSGPTRARGFPRSVRLTNKPQFDTVHARGRRSGDAYFLVIALENHLAYPRLGLAVGVRAAGNAVQRNRLKRLLREWFRHKQRETPALDIVVNVRPAAARASIATLAMSLEAHWERLRKQCARS